MESKKILHSSLTIFAIVVVFILIGFSVFNLYKTLAPTWGIGNSMTYTPYFSATCQKFKNNYEMTVTINNYNKEMKNVTCQLISNGGMVADKEKMEIPFVSPNSSDLCAFVLTGEPSRTTNVRVTYTLKGSFKYKDYSTITAPYPDCSTAITPETLPRGY